MAYALTFDDTLPESVERVRREQLDGAAAGLREEVTAASIHDARERLKRTRALLRLVRPGMKSKAYRRRSAGLRDAGRALSAARDASVLVETVDDLAERYSGRLAKSSFEKVRVPLAARAKAVMPNGSADTLARLAADEWPVRRVQLAVALEVTYVRGREAFKAADADPSVEHLHECRKRVKDLWYQQVLVEAAWPGVVKAQAKEAKKLSKLLGEDHDLAVLAALLREDKTLDGKPLLPLIDRRRAELLRKSRALGRRVYAERPEHFARRVGRYVELV